MLLLMMSTTTAAAAAAAAAASTNAQITWISIHKPSIIIVSRTTRTSFGVCACFVHINNAAQLSRIFYQNKNLLTK